MQQFTATVSGHREVAPNLVRVNLTAPPRMLRGAAAGQFVFVRASSADSHEPYLRRPYSLAAFDEEAGTLALLVRVVGRGSRWIAERVEGEELDVLGPLGSGFKLDERTRHLLVVIGGERQSHLAPVLQLLAPAAAREVTITMLIEADTATNLPPPSLLPPEVEYQTATRDGSAGHRGSALDFAKNLLPWADQVLAAGDDAFLARLKQLCAKLYPLPKVQAAVERNMACGVGVCLGCAVEVQGVGYLRACVEGPVFDLDRLALLS